MMIVSFLVYVKATLV